MNYLDILLQQKYELESRGKKPTTIKCNAEVLEYLKSQDDTYYKEVNDSSFIYNLKIIVDNEKSLEVL